MQQLLLSLLGLHCMALAIPGPDFTLVSRNALCKGRSAAVASAVGIALSVITALSAILFSLNLWHEQILVALYTARYLGAGFLLYLAYRVLTADSTYVAQTPLSQLTPLSLYVHRKALFEGFLCNLTNPKALFFFLSIFGVNAAELSSKAQFFLVAFMGISSFGWFYLIAYLLTSKWMRPFTSQIAHLQLYINRLSACVFTVFAIFLLIH